MMTSIKGHKSFEKEQYWAIFNFNLVLVHINVYIRFYQNPSLICSQDTLTLHTLGKIFLIFPMETIYMTCQILVFFWKNKKNITTLLSAELALGVVSKG